jgi:hypothetical protein
MKNIFTSYIVNSIYLLFTLSFMIVSVFAQQTGVFDKTLNLDGNSCQISFYVPSTGAPSKGFPLIIGMHPAQTPATAMRQMMQSSAQTLGAILACPEGPDGDGTAIMPLIEWVKDNYRIDSGKVVLTGYSAGGYPTFEVGLNNVSSFKGLIGIAPAVSSYGIDMSAVREVCIAIIVGKNDQMYSGIKSFNEAVKSAGGTTKLVEKTGVGHTGQYFWGSEFTTDWIECYNFCINTILKPKKISLSSPIDGAEEQPLQTTLSWNPISNATSYKIEISTSQGLFKSANQTQTSYAPAGLEKNIVYQWKVCGVNQSGDGQWSDTWTFTTISEAPALAPELTEPPDSADISELDVLFKWMPVENAIYYHIQLYDETNYELKFEDSLISSEASPLLYDIFDLTNDIKYKWRVRAYNGAGSGPWSEYRYFSTLPLPPDEYTELREPANNAVDLPLSLVFRWNTIARADKYHLQIKNKLDNSIVFNDTNISKPISGNIVEVTIDTLKPETSYGWKVRGTNRAGTGPWSIENNFTTGTEVSVDEPVKSIFNMSVYPNPVDGKLKLSFTLPLDGKTSIELYNSLACRTDLLFDGEATSGVNIQYFDFSNYPPGVYYLKLTSGIITENIGFVVN